MLNNQEAVVVFLQDGHKLEAGESSAHLQFREVAIQPAEDTGIITTDEENLVT